MAGHRKQFAQNKIKIDAYVNVVYSARWLAGELFAPEGAKVIVGVAGLCAWPPAG